MHPKSEAKLEVPDDIGFPKFLNNVELRGFPTWSLWAVDGPHLSTSHNPQTEARVQAPHWAGHHHASLSLSLARLLSFFPQAKIKFYSKTQKIQFILND